MHELLEFEMVWREDVYEPTSAPVRLSVRESAKGGRGLLDKARPLWQPEGAASLQHTLDLLFQVFRLREEVEGGAG